MTSPDAIGGLRRSRQRHPELLLGMGTVTTESQAVQVATAAVGFLVTPLTRPAVISRGIGDGVPPVGGNDAHGGGDDA